MIRAREVKVDALGRHRREESVHFRLAYVSLHSNDLQDERSDFKEVHRRAPTNRESASTRLGELKSAFMGSLWEQCGLMTENFWDLGLFREANSSVATVSAEWKFV